jgi:class 3 adenylate cyclase
VAVGFADLAGFTPMSQALEPRALAAWRGSICTPVSPWRLAIGSA